MHLIIIIRLKSVNTLRLKNEPVYGRANEINNMINNYGPIYLRKYTK